MRLLDQSTWTIISYMAGLITALAGGAAGAILTNRYTRSQERRRKERDVIEEIYALAITLRKSIEPSILGASSPYTTMPSNWYDQIIRMVALSDLYLPTLNPVLEELYKSIQSIDDAFKHVSYEMDGYGHATKKIMPDGFDETTESFKKNFMSLLVSLRELIKKRH